MIALFPYLWLSLAREDFTASSEFLDLINKAMNTNIGNDNLDDVSNNASGDSEEDDETKDKLKYLDCNGTGSVEATNKILAIN